MVAPGATWYCGFDLGDLSGYGANLNFAVYVHRNGDVADAAVDWEPVPDERPGLYVARVYVPADWSFGDSVQVRVSTRWESGQVALMWLPPFTLG